MAYPQQADLLWAHIDGMVAEIFSRMAGRRCEPVLETGAHETNFVARVAFGTRPQNVCEVALSDAAARVLVLELTGIDEDGLREDMAGELCNMIAGGWKSLFALPAEYNRLLPPSFGDTERAVAAEGEPGCLISRRYRFGSSEFTLHLRWCATVCFDQKAPGSPNHDLQPA